MKLGTRSSRTLAQLALALGLVALAVVVAGNPGGGAGHQLRAQFASAEQLAPGLEVRVAGRKVGDIDGVELARGRSIVTIDITESDVWPLPAGTTAEIRWGSTTSLEYRYIELHPGPKGVGVLGDRALIPERSTITPVELDQFYRIFRGRTAGETSALVHELGDTLASNGPALGAGLRNAPGGLDQTSSVLRELGAEQAATHQLVTQGDQVTRALAQRQGELRALVSHAAGTFDELALHAAHEQAALDLAPSALSEATSTLGRLDTSITGLQALVNDIAPGAVALQRLAPIARSALQELFAVGPLAESVLRRGTRAAPSLTGLLRTGTLFLPKLTNVLGQLAPMVGCILPYGPEIAGMLSTWSGFNQNYDSGGHYARTFDLTGNPLIVAGTPLTTPQVITASAGGLNYAMPRPPGLNAGQPFFQPKCDAGPSSLIAASDPEVGSP